MNRPQNDIEQKQERFLALLKPNHDSLARFARAMTKSREEAQDLVSDTIEQAFKHLDSLKSDDAFLSWLFTIASRIEKRRRWRERIFERFDPIFHDEAAEAFTRNPNAEALYDTQILYDALQKLPFKQREAFTLFEISGFSLQEIQELQGDSLSAVKMRLVRAREALRTMLGDTHSQERATIHHLTNPSNASALKMPKG
jgi:RNA polymerase sigma-70 factor (ECF subfamily)